jgi:exodeoxyribonuclease VIII
MPVPWQFWNSRCYRTVKSLYPDNKLKRSGTYHNAVDDAESQARHLIELLAKADLLARKL